MTNMPFIPPGLQWRGRSFITPRQLLEERDVRVPRKGKHGEANMESPSMIY